MNQQNVLAHRNEKTRKEATQLLEQIWLTLGMASAGAVGKSMGAMAASAKPVTDEPDLGFNRQCTTKTIGYCNSHHTCAYALIVAAINSCRN